MKVIGLYAKKKEGDDADEARERRNVEYAKWSVLEDGNLLPVTNIYDSDGNEIANPMHAATCVAYDAARQNQKWVVMRLEPGELWRRHNVEVPCESGARCH